MTITGLSHVAIAVPRIEDAARLLAQRFGLATGPIMENAAQGVRLAYVELGNSRLKLLEPASPQSPLARFLAAHPGGGLHHVSLSTADLDGVLEAIAGQGARQVGAAAVNVHGQRIAFVHPRDVLGVLVEIEEHSRT